MSRRETMVALAEEYLAARRALGFALRIEGQQLLTFARYADRGGHRGPLTTALAVRWATRPPVASPIGRARRLDTVRPFHAAEPEDSSMAEAGGAPGADPAACGTTPGDDLDGHALLEAGTRTLGETVEALAREYREAASQQRAQGAERAFTKFMKAQSELAK